MKETDPFPREALGSIFQKMLAVFLALSGQHPARPVEGK
jgi:hypothetical protein